MISCRHRSKIRTVNLRIVLTRERPQSAHAELKIANLQFCFSVELFIGRMREPKILLIQGKRSKRSRYAISDLLKVFVCARRERRLHF